jgi:hypothetical protein
MIRYPDAALKRFIEAAYDDDEALKWLLQNGYPELAAVKEAVICRETGPMTWLARYKKDALLLFVKAVLGNFNAIQRLLEMKEPLLAAAANAVRGDADALQWLRNNGFPAWADVSQAIQFNLPSRRKNVSYNTYSWDNDRDDRDHFDNIDFRGNGSGGGW